MKKLKYGLFTVLIAALLVQSCALVPLTGRRQLSLVSDADMLATSFVQYDQFMKENKSSTNSSQTNMVKGVGRRIQNAVSAYFDGIICPGTRWIRVGIQPHRKQGSQRLVHAGGKVVVYSGILPVTQNETGLAVVMGHEIAHAVAKHSNERMSQALVAELGGQTLAAALQQKPNRPAALDVPFRCRGPAWRDSAV